MPVSSPLRRFSGRSCAICDFRRLEGGVRKFRYLQSEVTALADVDEAEALRNTLDAMTIVGLSQAEQVCLNISLCF